MRWLAAVLVTCTVLCAAPAPAGAQSVVFYGGGSGVATQIPVRASGDLTVQFHGDSAAGCASLGLCEYGGTVSWQPGPRGVLEVISRGARHRTTAFFLAVDPSANGSGGGVTSAHVTLGAGLSGPSATNCVDATSTALGVGFRVRRARVTISLARSSPALLATRCAGPRDADIAPLLPAPTLSLGALRHGRVSIPLAVSHAFRTHGFSGTITSTVVLRLGRPGHEQPVVSRPSRGPERVRQLDVAYRVAVTGTVAEQVRAARNPLLCGPLGICHLGGTITLTPRARSHAVLTAQAFARRPVGALRAAVGLSAGPARGISAFGIAQWDGGGGVRSDLTQDAERCRDSGPLGSGALILHAFNGRLSIGYSAEGVFGGASMTRCPGPLAATALAASATVPVSALRGRIVRLHLTAGSRTSDAGYDIRFVPHMTVTVTRLSTRTTMLRLPAGTPIR